MSRHCVDSLLMFPPLQGGMDDTTGFPSDALDEAGTLEVTLASAECGLRWLKVFAPKRRSPIFLFLVDKALCFLRERGDVSASADISVLTPVFWELF